MIKSYELRKLDQTMQAVLKAEISKIRAQRHPSIASVYDKIEEEDKLHVVMELCDGNNALDHLLDGYSAGSGGERPTEASILQAAKYILTACNT